MKDRSKLVRLALAAPLLMGGVGLVGAVASVGEALLLRRALEWVGGIEPALAFAFRGIARCWYWGHGPLVGLLLLLLPMGAWARARGQDPWPLRLKLLLHLMMGLCAALLLVGEVRSVCLGVATSTLLAWSLGRWGAKTSAGRDVSCLGGLVSQALLWAPPVALGLLLPEPTWLRPSPVPPPGPGTLPALVAMALGWGALDQSAARLFHAVRARSFGPLASWMVPALLLAAAAVVGGSATRPVLGPLLVQGAPVVWIVGAGARLWPLPAVDPMRRPLGRSLALLGFVASVGAGFTDGWGATAASVLAGSVVAGAALVAETARVRHIGALDTLVEGQARWRRWVAIPWRLARRGGPPPSPRALLAAEDLVAQVLAHRARHPARPLEGLAWTLSPAETGNLAPLVNAIVERSDPDAPSPALEGDAQALGWLAHPRTLLAALDEDPAGALDRVERAASADPSPYRRLAWTWLRLRALAHLGRIDEMVRGGIATLDALASGELERALASGSVVDALRGEEGPYAAHPEQLRLASSSALVELAEALRAELDRVHALALAARDPAALSALAAHRAALAGHADAHLPAATPAVQEALDAARQAERLLERAWEHRRNPEAEATEALVTDTLRAWWTGGYAPLLARAAGEPAIARLFTAAWRAGVDRSLERSNALWENETWTDSIQRRLAAAVRRAPCAITAADWEAALDGRPAPPDGAYREVRGLLGDDLRGGPQAFGWCIRRSGLDPRQALMPAAHAALGAVSRAGRARMDDELTGWLPRPWRVSPRAALTLWEAAALGVAALPGGAEEAARLDAQRAWLADRLGDEDDRALARRRAVGPGLVARRVRAELAEAEVAAARTPESLLVAVERLAGGTGGGALPDLPAEDAVVIQVLLDRAVVTLRRDATGTRIARTPVDTFALLERIDRWRGALRAEIEGGDDADFVAEHVGAELHAPGILHYVGIGPLARLPIAALPRDGAELGRRQAWIRYERPSRVRSGYPEAAPELRAFWWSEADHPLPGAAPECARLAGPAAEEASRERVLLALAGATPVHVACHARGGRLDDSDAELRCSDGALKVNALGTLAVRAPIVYLSACETAAGSLVSGEHPMGLTGALLARGAPCVVATQWRLEDEASSLVAHRFWTGIRRGASPPRALRDAVARLDLPASRWALVEVNGGARPS